MTALLTHLRAEGRRRWPAWLAVVALIGVVGGLVFGALAGARRTDTAFARMVERTETADVMVNPNAGTDSALTIDDVRRIPGVRRAGQLDGGGAVLIGPDGQPDQRPLVLGPQDDSVLIDFNRPHVVEGHLYDPRDPSEVMVSDDLAAQLALHPGDTVDIGTVSMADLEAQGEPSADQPPRVTIHHLTVAGITIAPEAVVDDELFSFGTVLLSHAFVEQNDIAWFYWGIDVDLAGGASTLAAFRHDVSALVPDEAVEFQSLASTSETVARGTRPHVVALLAFAAVVGLTGLVVCGQALSRQLRLLEQESGVLHALGLPRRSIQRAGLARLGALVAAGLALAAGVAVALSAVFPVGPARRAEVDPGVRVDAVVLIPCLLVTAVLLFGWGAVSMRRFGARRPDAVRAPGRLAVLARSTSSVSAGLGIRATMTPTGGRSGTTAVAGAACAVGAVAAAMVFAASLSDFVSSPAEYGWGWDAMVSLPNDHGVADAMVEAIRSDPSFRASSVLTVDEVELAGDRIPAVGMTTGSDGPGITIADGRRPADGNEVALGKRTMRQLGVGIGDTVTAGDNSTSFRVVGQAVFPGLGTYEGADRTELGKGALFDAESLAGVGEGFGSAWAIVDGVDRSSLDAGLAAVNQQFSDQIEDQVDVVVRPQRPSDVLSLEQVRSTPVAIASVLGLLAAVAFGFVLLSGVRGRRRELALLKTFGFSRRQVAGTVVWQAAVTVGLAMVVGVPVGLVAGRIAWSTLTAAMGFAASPVVPVALAAVPIGALVVATALAVAPGRLAARTRPAVALRAE